MITEKYLVRRFSSIQQASEAADLENANTLPGAENPADGPTQVRSAVVPLLRLLEPGCFSPGSVEGLWWWLGGSKWTMGRTGINFACAHSGAIGPELTGELVGHE